MFSSHVCIHQGLCLRVWRCLYSILRENELFWAQLEIPAHAVVTFWKLLVAGGRRIPLLSQLVSVILRAEIHA